MSDTIRIYGRTLARSQALQLLFQAEATNRTVYEVLEGDYTLDRGPLDPYAEQLARGADDMRSDLDAIIAVTSSNWSLSRMPAVDRNLLRLALYEMLEVDEVAIAVSIDECVELAKAFGTDESQRFVNGVLGKVARKLDEGIDVIAEANARLAEEARMDEQSRLAGEDEPEDGYAPADEFEDGVVYQMVEDDDAYDSADEVEE